MKKLLLIIACVAMFFVFNTHLSVAKVPEKKIEFKTFVALATEIDAVVSNTNFYEPIKRLSCDVGDADHQVFDLTSMLGRYSFKNDKKPDNREINGILNTKSDSYLILTSNRQ